MEDNVDTIATGNQESTIRLPTPTGTRSPQDQQDINPGVINQEEEVGKFNSRKRRRIRLLLDARTELTDDELKV